MTITIIIQKYRTSKYRAPKMDEVLQKWSLMVIWYILAKTTRIRRYQPRQRRHHQIIS